jgi:hypothetical protein
MAMAVQQNRRGGRLGAIMQTAANVGAYIAGRAASGAVRGAGNRANSAAQRYFQGDVNQPVTARTVQSLRPLRAVNRRGAGRNTGAAMTTERGSCKLADITTVATTGTGRAIVSLPLILDLLGGRLFAMSKLYSRWKFVSAMLRYVPSVSSTTDGGIVVFYTQENDDSYAVDEAVGSQAASSAIDNMEFAVREKASMRLHLPSQLLYTSFSGKEMEWHSAGVINVVNNGGFVASAKTYGSLYLDFVVQFQQPSAPYDPWSPLHWLGTASGTSGSIFNWSTVAFYPDVGKAWYTNAVGQIESGGKIYLPPYSSAEVHVSGGSGGTSLLTITPENSLVTVPTGGISDQAADNTLKRTEARVTNSNPRVAWFTVNNASAAPFTNVAISAALVPYQPI